MARLERVLWLLGVVGAFAAGAAVFGARGSHVAPAGQSSEKNITGRSWLQWNERGRARAHRLDFKGAVEDFDQALVLNPTSAMLHNNRGGALLSLGDLRGSLKEFDAAISLDPAYAEARLNRGQTRSDLGDWSGAIEDLEKALALTDKSWAFRAFTIHRLDCAKGNHRKARVY